MVSSKVIASLAVQLWFQVASVRIQMEDDLVVAPAAEVSLAETTKESKPQDDDYWLEAGALERCRNARKGRFRKQVVGIPVGSVIAGPAIVFSGLLGLSAGMAYGAIEVVQWYTMYIAFTAVAVPTSITQAQKMANSVVENLPALLGANGHHPACCCNSSSFCALMGSTHSKLFQEQASCPEGWEHDATQCVAPELLAYERKTVSGCVCKEEEEEGLPGCEGNKLDRGHAWCEVEETADCGYQFSILKKQRRQGARWDYCRFAEYGMLEDGSVVVNNSALSAFVPNVRKKGLIPRVFSSANPWTLNTWVDRQKGVAIQRPSKLDRLSQCFAGIPVETLGGCAQKCLEEGAPNAKTMEGDQEMRYPCKAFAYNRQMRLCVRLPSFARDAEFTPRIKSLDAKGWQNFKTDQ